MTERDEIWVVYDPKSQHVRFNREITGKVYFERLMTLCFYRATVGGVR